MFCLGRLWLDRGGIAPELKTDDMTQPVGVGQDGRLWTKPTRGGGGNQPLVGSGELYDEYASITAGTYDYVIQGKLAVVTLHVPTAPLSVGLALTLKDFPDVEFDNQNFSVVYNEYGVATVTSMRIIFYQSGGTTYVNALNAGNGYVTNLVNANNYTFTIRIK